MRRARAEKAFFRTRTDAVREACLHILAGRHNVRSLAGVLGVSIPTVARVVESLRVALRREGRRLVSVRTKRGWHYEVLDDRGDGRLENDSLMVRGVRGRPVRLSEEDRSIYARD